MTFKLPTITAVVTICETNEVNEVKFTDVIEMMDSMMANARLAEVVFGRDVTLEEWEIAGDVCNMTFTYTDTGNAYMKVVATRDMRSDQSS